MSERLDGDQELIRRFLAETKTTGFGVPKVYGAGDDARWGLTANFVGPVKKDSKGKRRAVMSNELEDRHGDTLKASGVDLKYFRKNPVMLFGHRHDIPAVGKWENTDKSNGEVTGEPVFAPTALGEELGTLYDGGFMNAWSVGFIPKKWKPKKRQGEDGEEVDAGGYDITKWELLETSAVNVGANPEALSKAISAGTEREMLDALKGWRKALESSPAVVEGGSLDVEARADDIRPAFAEALDELRAKVAACEPVEHFKYKLFDCRKCGKPIYKLDDECWECEEPIDELSAAKDLACPKCGGEMRRAERPGPGREVTATLEVVSNISEQDIDSMSEYADECERAAGALARLKALREDIDRESGSTSAEQATVAVRACTPLDPKKVVELVAERLPELVNAAINRQMGKLSDKDVS